MKFLTVILKQFIHDVQDLDREYVAAIAMNKYKMSIPEAMATTKKYHQYKKAAYKLVKALDQQLAKKPMMVCQDEDKRVVYQLAGVTNQTAKEVYLQIKKLIQKPNCALTEDDAMKSIGNLSEYLKDYLCYFKEGADNHVNKKAMAVINVRDQIMRDYQECTHDFRDLHNLAMDVMLFNYAYRDAISTINVLMY